MSLVVLADGTRFEIQPPEGTRTGILHQRSRSILPLVFKAGEERFESIKSAFFDRTKTETITVYFPDEQESASDAQLDGVAHETYEGYTLVGDVKDEEIVVEEGTPTKPPVYGRQLSINMGQRQYDEA